MPTHRTEYLLTARDKTGKAFKSAEGGMKRLGVAAAAAAAAAVAAAAGMAAIVKQQAEAARSTRVYSESLGVSIEQMSRYEHAFKSVGIESEKTGDILKDIAEKIGDAYANNAGEAKEALDALGLSVAAINRLSPDQQLLAIAEGLEAVGTQGEKVQIMEALANDASRLLPLLEGNAAGLKELAANADATGRTLTKMESEALQKADEALLELDASMIGLKQTMAVELSPIITEAIGWFGRQLPIALDWANESVDNLAAGWLALMGVFEGKSFTDTLIEEMARFQAARDQSMSPIGRTSVEEENEAHATWLALKAEQQAQELELEWRHRDTVNRLLQTSDTERLAFSLKTWKAQTSIVAGELENITRGVAQESRSMFEINKAAGITNAIINTWQGVSESLANYPMPLAAAMAAVHFKAGMETVKAIEGTSFGSKSSGAPSLAGAGVPAVQTSPLEAPGIAGGGGSSITVIIEGSAVGDDRVRDLVVDAIKTAQDNDELNL
ncbi:MAG: hypothetical protein ACR2Q3_01620 [Woeseiaceae bacterium]